MSGIHLYRKLQQSIIENKIDEVVKACEEGVNRIPHEETGTPLETCADYDRIDIAKYLISIGEDADDDSALISSAVNGNVEMVKLLVENGANIHADSGEPLISSACIGNIELVKYFISEGANIHSQNEAALIKCAEEGHLEVVKLLVEKGATVNLGERNMSNPFIGASYHGHLEVVKFLVESGSKITDVNNEGFIGSASYGHTNLVSYYLEQGMDVHAPDQFGYKDGAIKVASHSGHIETVKLLIENGANPELAIRFGNGDVKEWANKYVNAKELDTKLTNALNQKSTEKSKAQELLTGIHAQGVKPISRPAMRAKI